MWTTIVTTLLPFAMKILAAYFDGKESDKDEKKAYLTFIQQMQKKQNQPAEIRASYDSQIERLKKQLAEEDQGQAK